MTDIKMADIKTKAAEALFPVLSLFHEVQGFALQNVRRNYADSCVGSFILDFGSRTLVVSVDSEDDTVALETIETSDSRFKQAEDLNGDSPWKEFIGRNFGWGWVTMNQQGCMDGVLLSFEGIDPQLVLTVKGSSLSVKRI